MCIVIFMWVNANTTSFKWLAHFKHYFHYNIFIKLALECVFALVSVQFKLTVFVHAFWCVDNFFSFQSANWLISYMCETFTYNLKELIRSNKSNKCMRIQQMDEPMNKQKKSIICFIDCAELFQTINKTNQIVMKRVMRVLMTHCIL